MELLKLKPIFLPLKVFRYKSYLMHHFQLLNSLFLFQVFLEVTIVFHSSLQAIMLIPTMTLINPSHYQHYCRIYQIIFYSSFSKIEISPCITFVLYLLFVLFFFKGCLWYCRRSMCHINIISIWIEDDVIGLVRHARLSI